MTAYISAKFEKDVLPVSNTVRVITRNIDNGDVPPNPSAVYFPTFPDDFQPFIRAQYHNDVTGESVDQAAELSDFISLFYSPLNIFEDSTASLGPVLVGDTLTITLSPTELWTSQEYPSVTFVFTVDALISATQVFIAEQFPGFQLNMTWAISRGISPIVSGVVGATRRFGVTAPGQKFLERRFNSYFLSAIEAENFIEATKAEMVALANEDVGVTVIEDFTAGPTP